MCPWKLIEFYNNDTLSLLYLLILADLEKQPYYTKAMQLTQQYPSLDDMLGDGWKAQWIRRGMLSNTSIGKDLVTLDIPVSGNKDRGTMLVTASRDDGV